MQYPDITVLYRLDIAQPILFGCCDFLAQSILVRATDNALFIQFIHLIFQKIHRCWVVWGCNIRVVVIPSILSIAYLGRSIYLDSLADSLDLLSLVMWWAAGIGAFSIRQGRIHVNLWTSPLVLTSLIVSLTVNALVTGLIVFKIFEVYREVKDNTISDEKSLGVTAGSKLRSVMFVIIESGMALFVIQLVRLAISTQLPFTDAVSDAYTLIVVLYEMINVIISSVIATLHFTDDVDLARVSHLPSSWCGCQWDCLSTTRHLW